MTGQDVRPGQVWADNDSRCEGRRTLRIEQVDGDKAVCLILTDWTGNTDGKHQTRIALRRFRPNSTGYRLVKDAEVPS